MENKNIFLTAEERYDVYLVKSSERPHLLETFQTTNHVDDADSLSTPPLTDGCDIPAWRSGRMIETGPEMEAAFNIGLGCPLLRRESQLPVPLAMSQKQSRWELLREKLMHQPATETVERISYSEAIQGFDVNEGEVADDDDIGLRDNQQRKRRLFSKWEANNYPVIIEGCTTGWNLNAWHFEKLVERFGHIRWRFSDTHGAVMSLETWAKYTATEGLVDDSPLAVYDSEFGDNDAPMHPLTDDYVTPLCFSDDLFALAINEKENDNDLAGSSDTTADSSYGTPNLDLSDRRADSDCDISSNNSSNVSNNTNSPRPPWRWILMGPPRSGTGLHIDPLWTNAWVTLLEGTKRWILVPPHVQSHLPDGAGLREPQVPSVIWFQEYYDRVVTLEGVVEILQRPGETVFVPNGWPHLVLNLERTVAITHNYASEFGPFERMWEQVAEDEPDFAQRWYRGLCLHRQDLASRIPIYQLGK